MTNLQIVGLGVRLFAIWLVVYLLRHVPGMWSLATDQMPDVRVATVVAVFSGLTILVIAGLWFFPLFVARKLLPQATLEASTSLPLDQARRAGFCLLGLWLLTEALPRAINALIMLYYSARPDASIELRPHNYAAMWQIFVELCMGTWLLFGARGLLGLLHWARTAGISEPSDGTSEVDAQRRSDGRG